VLTKCRQSHGQSTAANCKVRGEIRVSDSERFAIIVSPGFEVESQHSISKYYQKSVEDWGKFFTGANAGKLVTKLA
jgi:hypothetical protein